MEIRLSNEHINYPCFSKHVSLTKRAIVRVGRSGIRKVAVKNVIGIPREYDLMTLRNSNIIQFYHCEGIVQVMDFADGGTLANNILNIGDYREDIAKQVNRGLVYLHSMGFVHKKLRTSNILLTRNFDAKIAGFGSDDIDLDPAMIAPELLTDPSKYSPASDIFALGRVLESMGNGSDEYMRWMKTCLDENPDCRPLRCPIVAQKPKSVTLFEVGKGLSQLEALDKIAQNGDATLAHVLGTWYNSGFKVKKDKVKAMEYFRLGANLGNGEAQTEVGRHHYHEGEYADAEVWLRKAAEQKEFGARVSLAGLYYNTGRYPEALRMYKHIAPSCTQSQYILGEMYFRGLPVQDDALALKWYIEAANRGHADAAYSAGYMYERGRGVIASYENAEKWYHAAIDINKEHSPAQKALESMRLIAYLFRYVA